MRGMPRVATLSTWVSPRWNRPEPCTLGSTPTSADSGRMSVVPRPSMRRPSSTMRRRTSFLVSDRTAALISPSRPSNSEDSSAMMALVTSSVWELRSALSAMATTVATRSEPTADTRSKTSSP